MTALQSDNSFKGTGCKGRILFCHSDDAGAEVWGECTKGKGEIVIYMLKNMLSRTEECDPLPLQISLRPYHYPRLGLYSVLHCLSHTGKRDGNSAQNSTHNSQAELIMHNMLNKLLFKSSIPEVN